MANFQQTLNQLITEYTSQVLRLYFPSYDVLKFDGKLEFKIRNRDNVLIYFDENLSSPDELNIDLPVLSSIFDKTDPEILIKQEDITAEGAVADNNDDSADGTETAAEAETVNLSDEVISENNAENGRTANVVIEPVICKFVCTICKGKSYKTKGHLEKHMNQCTGLPRGAWPCHCGKVYSTKLILERHVNIVHEGCGKEYQCELCVKSFHHEARLKSHMDIKHSMDSMGTSIDEVKAELGAQLHSELAAPPYGCGLCGDAMAQISDLEEHVTEHKDPVQGEHFQCTLCKEMFTESEQLKVHVQNKRYKYQCKVCAKSFQDFTYLKQHYRIHNSGDHLCSVCGKSFSNSAYLKQHLRIHNVRERNLKCQLCDKTFALHNYLHKHMETHKEKKYVCDVCGTAYTRKFDLQGHMRSHTGEKPFKCPDCDRSFTKKSILNDHRLIHSDVRHPCSKCERTFARSKDLNWHIKWTHTHEKLQLACDQCDKSFTTKYQLLKHIQRHLTPHPCSECDKTFSTKHELREHQRLTGEKPYRCSFCNHAFLLQTLLNKHLRIHTGDKPYQCQTCGATFARSTALLYHTRIHTGEKPYKCAICSKAFRILHSRVLHMRTHTGVKPHKCNYCEKAFSHPTNLRQHRKTHTGQKSAQCETCRKTFSNKSALVRHIKTHTGETPFECMTCNKTFSQKCHLDRHAKTHRKEKAYQCEPNY